MRDALSLLDQAIAHGGNRVAAGPVREMLGTIDQGYLLGLLTALVGEDAAAVLRTADEMQARSLSFDQALADLASLLLKLAILHSLPEALEADLPERAQLAELAARLDPESVQLYYQITLQGREDLPLAPDEHAGFVMTLLRMLAFRPEGAAGGLPRSEAVKPRGGSTKPSPAATSAEWPQLVQQLSLTGAARELARHAELQGRDDERFDLLVPKSKAYLAERSYQDKLKAALETHFGATVTLKVTLGETSGASAAAIEAGERDARHAETQRAVQADGFVKDLVNLFDGKVVDSTPREERK
jgi:DNA polymerase-3 subunit gamma/tau